MSYRTDRRRFLKTTALTGAGFWVAGTAQANDKEKDSQSPNEKIRFACVGVGGKGSSDTEDASKHGDVVAICDIDDKRLDAAAGKYPDAKKFNDYRVMFDEMGSNIDAVTVSTPDHSHAPASVMAMQMGKHVYCQKPLTHSIFEARRMAEVAKEQGVVTQMGNQGTANDGVRKAAAMIKAGLLGDVSEVHVWTNRPIWPQGVEPKETEDIPAHVHWDLFLGPAPYRPYAKNYHPFNWRGWWDFGTGALGDMACHTLNMPYMALDLKDPTSVQAETAGHNRQSYPKWSVITYEFPATDARPAVKLTWYDGGKLPPAELFGDEKPKNSGSLIIGSKGKLYSPDDYGAEYVMLGDITEPEVEYTASPGHFTEWVEGIKGGPAPMSNFPGYSSGLTETVLLGNLAVWVNGPKVEWDAKSMSSPNNTDVVQLIHREYRDGYKL